MILEDGYPVEDVRARFTVWKPVKEPAKVLPLALLSLLLLEVLEVPKVLLPQLGLLPHAADVPLLERLRDPERGLLRPPVRGDVEETLVVRIVVVVEQVPQHGARLRRLHVPILREGDLGVRRARVLALVQVAGALAVSDQNYPLGQPARGHPVRVSLAVDVREPLQILQRHAHRVVPLVIRPFLVDAGLLVARLDRPQARGPRFRPSTHFIQCYPLACHRAALRFGNLATPDEAGSRRRRTGAKSEHLLVCKGEEDAEGAMCALQTVPGWPLRGGYRPTFCFLVFARAAS